MYVSKNKIFRNKFEGKLVSNLDTCYTLITLIKTKTDTQQQIPNINTNSLVCLGLHILPNEMKARRLLSRLFRKKPKYVFKWG